MLCSEYELGLSNESKGIIELTEQQKIGKSFFNNVSEPILDIAVTPNRPDCLGVRGIAWDLASSGLGKLINQPKIKIKQINEWNNKRKIMNMYSKKIVTRKIL